MEKAYSAGGIVVSSLGVLVVNQNHDSWSLPKGHRESGETDEQAARREIQEESGVSQLDLVEDLGSYERFQIALGGVGENTRQLKSIHLFLFSTVQLELHPEDPANPEAKWVGIDTVPSFLSHPEDIAFFQSVQPRTEALLATLR
jgi:ADP-ribose pyrophosphatase YjhB (NUDIX family)